MFHVKHKQEFKEGKTGLKKLFWEDPYLQEISARVTSVNENVITIDKTIAYAFSGGQASDSGTINEYKIIEAKKLMVIELAPHKLYFHNLCMLSANGRKVDLPRSVY